MKTEKLALLLVAGTALLSCSVLKRPAKEKPGAATPSAETAKAADSTKKPVKPYGQVITGKAITDDGLFKVHQVDERYFFEIRNELFDRDILVVNRVSKAAAGMKPDRGLSGYAGERIGENVIQFQKGPENKVFIRRISFLDIAGDSSENGMARSLHNSSLQAIAAAFDIKAFSPDSSGVVIDMTDYIKGDNDLLFFNPQSKHLFELGGLLADRSYIAHIHSYPVNTEIRTVKTYTKGGKGVESGSAATTYELNSSMVLLPETPMKPREYDERIGYFSRGYRHFDASKGVDVEFMITRWRLEPKDEDIEKYKRGELVEPKKPIVFYIDPATPHKWVPYLVQGVKDWQSAFEKAGFKNAIYALEAPKDDPTWSLEDARHNVILYMASEVANAMGPHVHDPRTGEILESHIQWYHNIVQLLRDWYMVQAGPNDPRARKMNFDDELMGQLVRYVCTHEVGHTLGLQHNFRASTTVPVDSLRSRTYVAQHGHTPSVMDYARFNYVAQPEDHIDVKDLIPRIGGYDEWAIEWGYRWMPPSPSAVEKERLNQWVIRRLNADKHLVFSDGRLPDFSLKAEDLGDDAARAGEYGIRNLRRVMANLKDWTQTPGEGYENMQRIYAAVITQYNHYISHVIDDIGALYRTPNTMEQGGPLYDFASRKKQETAVQFLHRYFFSGTAWLDDRAINTYLGPYGHVWVYKMHEYWLHRLMEPLFTFRMLGNATTAPASEVYSYNHLLNDVEEGLYKELNTHQPIEMTRRNLQKIYVFKLSSVLRRQSEGDFAMLDVNSIFLDHLRSVYNRIDKALPGYKHPESVAHLRDLQDRLRLLLKGSPERLPELRFTMPGNTLSFQMPGMEPAHLSGQGCFEFANPWQLEQPDR